MSMPTYRTLATCSSFGASEAHDVSTFGFVGEVVDIFPIFPQGHALIMVSSAIAVTDPMRITDEERTHMLLYTEVDDLSAGLVTHITYTTFSPSTHLVLGTLKFLPAARVLLATGLLLSESSKLLMALPLEGTDTAP
jgi:hypothetical protein